MEGNIKKNTPRRQERKVQTKIRKPYFLKKANVRTVEEDEKGQKERGRGYKVPILGTNLGIYLKNPEPRIYSKSKS